MTLSAAADIVFSLRWEKQYLLRAGVRFPALLVFRRLYLSEAGFSGFIGFAG